MKIRILAIVFYTISCFLFLFMFDNPFSAVSINSLVPKALAADACNSNGKITLDASKSSIQGAGTVWSNNALDQGQSAVKSAHTSIKSSAEDPGR